MESRARLLGASLLVLLGVSGCPVTDDYYLETSHIQGNGGSAGETTLAAAGSLAGRGGTSAVEPSAGTAGTGGNVEPPPGGAPDTGVVAGAGADAGGAPACEAVTERCNGHDDDCDQLVDELACNSETNDTVDCSAFVLPERPNHGYMLCSGTRAYAQAQDACAAQNMQLAVLQSEAENSSVSERVAALSNDAEVTFGATDASDEGEWFWADGVQFWSGDENGTPVAGEFNSWHQGAPNDRDRTENCIVLMSATATWGDRACSAKYAYLCEELEP